MRSSIALVLIALASATAFAKPPKYTRPQATPTVTSTFRARPLPPAQPTRMRPVTADDAMRIEEQLLPVRHEQEVILVGLARDTPDGDPDKPDYLFRLAEHYAAELRFWKIKAVEQSLVKDAP